MRKMMMNENMLGNISLVIFQQRSLVVVDSVVKDFAVVPVPRSFLLRWLRARTETLQSSGKAPLLLLLDMPRREIELEDGR